MVLDIWKDAVDFIDTDVKEWMAEAFHKYKDEAVKLNKENLSSGRLRTGENLSPSEYSNPYKKVRIQYGRPLSPKDLNLTGDYHGGIYGTSFPDFFEMGSDDRKELILEHNWGEIHGIPDDKLDSLLETYIFPYIRERFIKNFR